MQVQWYLTLTSCGVSTYDTGSSSAATLDSTDHVATPPNPFALEGGHRLIIGKESHRWNTTRTSLLAEGARDVVVRLDFDGICTGNVLPQAPDADKSILVDVVQFFNDISY